MKGNTKSVSVLEAITLHDIKTQEISSEMLEREPEENFFRLIGRLDEGNVLSRKDISDTLRVKMIKANPQGLKYIDPSDTAAYNEIVCEAVKGSPGVVLHVQESALTKELLKQIFTASYGAAQVLLSRHPKILEKLLDEDICGFFVSKDINMVEHLPRALVTDQALKDGVKVSPKSTHILVDLNKSHLLVELVKEGYWPESDIKVLHPESIDMGVKSLSWEMTIFNVNELADGEAHEYTLHWLKAFLKSYPIQEIVSYMAKNEGMRSTLMKLHPEDVVKPYALKHKELKRFFLGHDLDL